MAPKDILHKQLLITVAKTTSDDRGGTLLFRIALNKSGTLVRWYSRSTGIKYRIPLTLLNSIYIILFTHDSLDDGSIVVRFPAGAKISSLLQNVQACTAALPAHYSMETGGCFPEEELRA
jgi:hypothetical protein